MFDNKHIRVAAMALAFWAATALAARAEEAPPETQPETKPATPEVPSGAPVFTLPSVEIIGTTPVQGVGIEKAKVPANVQTITTPASERPASPTLSDILNSSVGSVTVNDTTVNPFQPDVSFRGFTASPLLGVPQGIAIYQNGVRVNEPFGDTVQWDVVPEFAINQVQVIPGANPVFGLNALGGAIALEMKNGFNFHGFSSDTYGGSWNRVQSTMEYGAQEDNLGFYIGGTGFDESGWRDFSPSKLGQIYGDARWRGNNGEAGLSFGYATTRLGGVQPSPVELLAEDRAAAFTAPDFIDNELIAITGDGNYFASDTVSFQGNVHYRRLITHGLNSNTADFAPCTGVAGPPSTLCENPGAGETQVLDIAGHPISSNVGGDATDLTSTTDTATTGGVIQTTLTDDVAGLKNQFVAGTSLDFATVNYHNENNVGHLDDRRFVVASGIFLGGQDNNTRLDTENMYFGAFFSDTLSVTDDLAVTAAGRYNIATEKLIDRFGTDLNGDHEFIRFNPALGATYQFAGNLTGYGNYSEANRAPTAVELSCADPNQPCHVPNAFLSDPALQQVVNRSVEFGMRGNVKAFEGKAPVNWSTAIFGSRNYNDIIFVATSATGGSGFFQNAGITQRVGAEVNLNGTAGDFGWYLDYSFIRATFESNLTVASPANPFADASGDIKVKPGDRIPGIPLHSVKAGVNYNVTERWNVALESIVNSSVFLRGDEANLLDQVPGYAVFNLRSSYKVTDYLDAFVKVNNIFDTDYETFGTLGDPTDVAQFSNFHDPRFLSPGPPIGAWVGVRVTL